MTLLTLNNTAYKYLSIRRDFELHVKLLYKLKVSILNGKQTETVMF